MPSWAAGSVLSAYLARTGLNRGCSPHSRAHARTHPPQWSVGSGSRRQAAGWTPDRGPAGSSQSSKPTTPPPPKTHGTGSWCSACAAGWAGPAWRPVAVGWLVSWQGGAAQGALSGVSSRCWCWCWGLLCGPSHNPASTPNAHLHRLPQLSTTPRTQHAQGRTQQRKRWKARPPSPTSHTFGASRAQSACSGGTALWAPWAGSKTPHCTRGQPLWPRQRGRRLFVRGPPPLVGSQGSVRHLCMANITYVWIDSRGGWTRAEGCGCVEVGPHVQLGQWWKTGLGGESAWARFNADGRHDDPAPVPVPVPCEPCASQVVMHPPLKCTLAGRSQASLVSFVTV